MLDKAAKKKEEEALRRRADAAEDESRRLGRELERLVGEVAEARQAAARERDDADAECRLVASLRADKCRLEGEMGRLLADNSAQVTSYDAPHVDPMHKALPRLIWVMLVMYGADMGPVFDRSGIESPLNQTFVVPSGLPGHSPF